MMLSCLTTVNAATDLPVGLSAPVTSTLKTVMSRGAAAVMMWLPAVSMARGA